MTDIRIRKIENSGKPMNAPIASIEINEKGNLAFNMSETTSPVASRKAAGQKMTDIRIRNFESGQSDQMNAHPESTSTRKAMKILEDSRNLEDLKALMPANSKFDYFSMTAEILNICRNEFQRVVNVDATLLEKYCIRKLESGITNLARLAWQALINCNSGADG